MLTTKRCYDEIQQLIDKEVEAHFAIEEDELFPALLAENSDPKVIQLIDELCREHAPLLEKVRRLKAMLHEGKLAHCTNDFWVEELHFLINFEKHAAKEEKLLKMFPE